MNAMGVIDMRSDTVTRPTARMRQAMFEAEVGDDCFAEDPTVTRFEAMAAERLGKEAAIYLPSGTMANSTALTAHLEGTAGPALVIHEERAHMFSADRDRFARALFEIRTAAIDTEWGGITAEQVRAAVEAYSDTIPRLLCIENSHNHRSGSALTPCQVRTVCAEARAAGMRVHCDGARIFNAAVAQSIPAADLVREVDSVMFCISKGLSAPVGSVLCGDTAFIEVAAAVRKIHGGAMRQAGVIAAAGIVALEEMVVRLARDNENASKLCAALDGIDGIDVVIPPIPTNFVVVDAAGLGWSSDELLARYAVEGVLGIARLPTRVRLVLNRHVGAKEVARVAELTRLIAAAA